MNQIQSETSTRCQQAQKHRVQLFTERNQFKARAEALEQQLIEHRKRSFLVIIILMAVIVLMFGGYILCLELMLDLPKTTGLLSSHFGKN